MFKARGLILAHKLISVPLQADENQSLIFNFNKLRLPEICTQKRDATIKLNTSISTAGLASS